MEDTNKIRIDFIQYRQLDDENEIASGNYYGILMEREGSAPVILRYDDYNALILNVESHDSLYAFIEDNTSFLSDPDFNKDVYVLFLGEKYTLDVCKTFTTGRPDEDDEE